MPRHAEPLCALKDEPALFSRVENKSNNNFHCFFTIQNKGDFLGLRKKKDWAWGREVAVRRFFVGPKEHPRGTKGHQSHSLPVGHHFFFVIFLRNNIFFLLTNFFFQPPRSAGKNRLDEIARRSKRVGGAIADLWGSHLVGK